MNTRLKKALDAGRSWMEKTHFSFVALPSLGDASRSAGSVMDTLRDVQMQSDKLRKGAKCACDVANSVCKPVNDWSRSAAYRAPRYQLMPQAQYMSPMRGTPLLDPMQLDKNQLIQLAATGMVDMSDGPPAAA